MSGRETDDYLEVLLARHRRRQGVKYRSDSGSVNLNQIIRDETNSPYKPRTVSFGLPSVDSHRDGHFAEAGKYSEFLFETIITMMMEFL